MSKIQVLLVEETPSRLKWLSKELRDEHYQVYTAHTGQEALYQLFKNPTTQVIVISSSITDMTAHNLILKIREFVGIPHIIVLGNNLTPQMAIDLMRAGAGDIVKLPFHELELKIAIKQSFEADIAMEQLNRHWERNLEDEIASRIKAFREFLDERRIAGKPVKPSEISLYFPGQDDPNVDLSTQDVIQVIKDKTDLKKSHHWPKPVVLTIDDEATVSRSLKLALGKEFKVLQASSGEMGFEILKAQNMKVDAIVLDIGMPGTSGDKWVAAMKEVDPSMSVVMLTAYDDVDLIVNSIRAGAHDYFVKPFDNEQILDRMCKVVQRKLMVEKLAQWVDTKRYRVKPHAA